ncbi:MAG: hypothetical protein ACYC1E_12175 [Propionibacteriaceae bacterium]
MYDLRCDPAASVLDTTLLLNQAFGQATEFGELLEAAQAAISEQGFGSPAVDSPDAAPRSQPPRERPAMNMTIIERQTHSDPRGVLLKAAGVVPDVIIGSLIGLAIVAALPPAVGFGVTIAGVSVAAVLAAGFAENSAVRFLHGARRPTPTEAMRLAAPWRLVASWVDTTGVHLRIVSNGPPVVTAGRRHIILARDIVDAYLAGQLTDYEIAGLITHGFGRLYWGYTRFDLLWAFWTAPWDFIRGLFVGAGRHLTWVPLARFAWQTRFMVGAIGVVLETQAGRWPSPILIATFIALTHLMPAWQRKWEQYLADQSDHFAAQVGFGSHLARFLQRLPPRPDLLDRIESLTRPEVAAYSSRSVLSIATHIQPVRS